MEPNNLIDKDVFREKFGLLCELTGRQFSDALIDAYYDALANPHESKCLNEPITTEEFVQANDHFFARAYFPSPREFFSAIRSLRKFDIIFG